MKLIVFNNQITIFFILTHKNVKIKIGILDELFYKIGYNYEISNVIISKRKRDREN